MSRSSLVVGGLGDQGFHSCDMQNEYGGNLTFQGLVYLDRGHRRHGRSRETGPCVGIWSEPSDL